MQAIERVGLKPGKDVRLGLDSASSESSRGSYRLEGEGKTSMRRHGGTLREAGIRLSHRTIEDGMAEDDWEGWAELTRRLGRKVQLVGDDVSSPIRPSRRRHPPPYRQWPS